MYQITRTNPKVFAEEKFNNKYRGFYPSSSETKEETLARFERLKKKCIKKFRVCDDDNIWYFAGVSTTDNDDRAFQPLDDLGVMYGCTYIEYWNADKKEWEML